MRRMQPWFQWPVRQSLMCRLAQKWRRLGLIGLLGLTFREQRAGHGRDPVMTTQPFGCIGVIGVRDPFGVAIVQTNLAPRELAHGEFR
jgi:hypothetical protein